MFQSIVEAILHFAETQPEKLCLVDDNNELTYAEYAEKIRKYAGYFKKIGFTSDSRVVIEANQSVEYLAIQMGLQLIGAVFVPVEHNCAEEKIANFIRRSEAVSVIVNKNEDRYEVAHPFCYETIIARAEETEALTVEKLPAIDDICEILFSTGTTGKEKGIVITHKNNIALAHNVMHGVEMKPDNVEMIPSPMNHSHGLRRYYTNMYNGCTVVILGSVMDIARFFRNIDRYGVNSMDLVPSALAVVLRLSKGKLGEYADQIRYIQIGSAPMMDQDMKETSALLPKTHLYNFYGSTESGCTYIYDYNTPNPKKHCIGKPTYSVTALIVDDDRNPIVSSKENTGTVATAGDMNMLCYWQDEEETKRAMANGIVYSNDVGYVDEDGDIILLGRKGDIINVGGNKVSPDEIENAVKKMKEVADCGCIATPDKTRGQVPKLFVQMAPGAAFDAKAIRTFLTEQMEPYKVPVYIEEIEKIPRTFNGKILRKELR